MKPDAEPSSLTSVPQTKIRRKRSSAEHRGVLRCGHCGSQEMRRQPRAIADWLSFRTSYQCGRCTKRERHLHFTWRLPLLAMGLVAVASGAVYVWTHPPEWWAGSPDSTQALARARASSGGQLSAFEEMMVRRPKSTLVNANILEMTKAGLRPDVIVRLIRASNADFDLRANSVIELKKAGVDATVILAMIDQSYGNR